jgi:hypothetical protein
MLGNGGERRMFGREESRRKMEKNELSRVPWAVSLASCYVIARLYVAE